MYEISMCHILIILLIIHTTAFSKDFGVVGQTFKIVEEPFIQMLKQRLAGIDIDKEQQKIQAQVRKRVENPLPVSGIEPAVQDRVFYFDPTYILDQDIFLPCGKLLHKAGTKVNPLEHMELARRLLFIDSREAQQISWLKEQLDIPVPKREGKEQIENRVILIGGSVFKLKEQLGEQYKDQVYFDQAGELTSKFGIQASPAVVEQEGVEIRIKEIAL